MAHTLMGADVLFGVTQVRTSVSVLSPLLGMP